MKLPSDQRLRLLFAVAFAISVIPLCSIAVSAQQNKDKSKFASLDGTRIRYVNYGKGDEALVLIHGWTQNIDSWRDQIPDFAKRNRVMQSNCPATDRVTSHRSYTAWICLRVRWKQLCAMQR